VAGKPDASELFQRLVLPEGDRKRMPKRARPLAAETIATIRAWIEQGATLAGAGSDPAMADAPASSPMPQALPDVLPAPPDAVARLKAAGAQVVPLFQDSPLLEVSYASRTEPAGDAELELLNDVADQVIGLNLKGAQASAAGFAVLGKLRNLRRLHLELSSITDAALQHAAGLGGLEYLNLYGTQITDAGLQHLGSLHQLRSLYLWQTQVSYDAAMALAHHIDALKVDLGHDHPAVLRQRMTAEIESLGKLLTEVTTEEQAAQRVLDVARRWKETLQARLIERENALKSLDQPPAAAPAKLPDARQPNSTAATEPGGGDA
jgi:hypothetical protein